MNDFDSGADTRNVRDRFPDMEPIDSAPSLYTLNGIGTSLYGNRDFDEETQTFIKTFVFTVLFVPIFALRAYRVSKADEGWYFIGRSPLSSLEKGWNGLVGVSLAAVLSVVAYNHHTGSPEYRDKQEMADAAELIESGDLPAAAEVYRRLAVGSTQAGPARKALGALVDSAGAHLEHAAAVYALAASTQRRLGEPVHEGLVASALEFAKTHGAERPLVAADTLDAVELIADADQRNLLATAKVPVLEALHEASPESIPLAVRLAGAYELTADADAALGLLEPRADKLEGTDGARILGQLYAGMGDYDRAYALLEPYTRSRLDRLRSAEAAYNAEVDKLWNEEIAILEDGKGAEWFYKRYDAARPGQQETVLNDYVWPRIQDNPELLAKRDQMADASAIVPVAMDLGMVMLQRAQSASSDEERTEQLEDAERVFLGIQAYADSSEAYQLYLAQVKHWLGKREEAKALFDQALEAGGRKVDTLLGVGGTLRALGSASEARSLFEEAHKKANSDDERYRAARMRALVFIDLDDEIEWLEKSNPIDHHVRGTLAESRGHQAFKAGDHEAAAERYREAIAIYEEAPESSSQLNNRALIHRALHRVTGDIAEYDRALSLLERGLELLPDEPIMLFNLASALMRRGAIELYGSRVDFHVARTGASLDAARWFYDDAAGRARESKRIVEDRFVKRALTIYERLLVIHSDSSELYDELRSYYVLTNQVEPLKRLAERLANAEPDVADGIKSAVDHYNAVDDDKRRSEFESSIAQMQKRLEGKDADSTIEMSMLRAQLAGRMLSASHLGIETELDEVVRLAERSLRDSPCSATRSTLASARFARASESVASASPKYAKIRKRTHRALAPEVTLALAGSQDEEIRATIVSDPEFKASFTLLEQLNQRFPESRTANDWALGRLAKPGEAENVAAQVREYELDRVDQGIQVQLNPASLGSAVSAYWRAQVEGVAESEARAQIQRAVDRGAPAPFDAL